MWMMCLGPDDESFTSKPSTFDTSIITMDGLNKGEGRRSDVWTFWTVILSAPLF